MSGETRSRAEWVRPLRAHIGLVFVLILVAFSTPALWISYQRGYTVAIATIDNELDDLADRIFDHYAMTFADKLALVQIGGALDSMSTPPPSDLTAKRQYLFEAIELAPNMDGLFVGYPDGRFLRVVSLRDGSPWRDAIEAPDDAVAAMEMVVPDATGAPTVRWTFLGAGGEPISFKPVAPTDFDPRTRPWYQEAIEAGGPVATEPYVMPLSGAYVKTFADIHRYAPGVVVAGDILLKSVSEFLAGQQLSPHSDSYVFDEDDKLIVHSDPEVMEELIEHANGHRDTDHTYLYDEDPMLPPVLEALHSVESGRTHFQLDGETYEAIFIPLGALSGLDGYTIAIAAPQSDFTAKVTAELRSGLVMAGIVLALGVAVSIVFARAISRSLSQLTEQALRLKQFDFAEMPPIRSHIAEIVDLAGAIAAARTAIRSFGFYVPKELVRRIVGSGLFDRDSAARQEVTVMFTDIKDFTTFSELNEPEMVVAALSDYFELMNSIVEAHGGSVIQFIGDAVYAMWNAPVADPDHAANACRCALDIQSALTTFNAARLADGKPELLTRIGIHTGAAVVGNVGAEDRLQYTAIGDTINVAARLEGLNKELGSKILVSRETRVRCADSFAFAGHGQIQVKGRAEPVEVYEPTGANTEGGEP
jgi:adenylate cyclase